MDNCITITKSDYHLFQDVPIHLWKEKHGGINIIQTEFEIHIMNQGYEVEGFAKNYLEKFVVNADEGESVQFQKTFSDKHFLARTDALIFNLSHSQNYPKEEDPIIGARDTGY